MTAIIADVTTDAGREALLTACPNPDIVINNAGGQPAGDFRDGSQADSFEPVNANLYTAIVMILRTLDGMIDRNFGRVVNITSSAVKQPIAELGLSNGARSGFTGFVSGSCSRPVTPQCHDQSICCQAISRRAAYRHMLHARAEQAMSSA